MRDKRTGKSQMDNQRQLKIVVACLTRQRPQMLRTLLDSIGQMSLPSAATVSCVIVENDKADQSSAIIHSLSPLQNGVEVSYFLETELGIPFGRNRAAKEALAIGADLLAFVDDDEVVAVDWLVRLVAGYRASKAVLLGAPLRAAPLHPSAGWLQRLIHSNVVARYRKKETRAARLADLTGTPGVTIVTNNWLGELTLFSQHGIWFDEAMRFTGGTDSKFHAEVRARNLPTAWVADAFVYETIPPERLSFVYQYCRGRDQSNTAFHRKLKSERFARLKLIGSLPIRLLFVLALAVAVPFSRGQTLLPLARGMGWIAGRVGALFGRKSSLYKNVTGS